MLPPEYPGSNWQGADVEEESPPEHHWSVTKALIAFWDKGQGVSGF